MNTHLLAATALLIGIAQANAIASDQVSVPDPSSQARHELASWIYNDISDYIVRLKKHCYCKYSGEEFAINVRNHKVVDIVHTTSGEPLPKEDWQLFPTVDRLHCMIIAQRAIVHEVAVLYDPQWNLPIRLFIDPEGSTDGDEITYEVTRFLPLLDKWQGASLSNQFGVDVR